MKRNINLVLDLSAPTIADSENVAIGMLDKVVNYSTDTIFCDILEFIDNNKLSDTLIDVLRKLRLGGICIIKFSNYKEQCRMYAQGTITDSQLLALLKNKSNVVSLDTIYRLLESLHQEINIININIAAEYIAVVLQRTSV